MRRSISILVGVFLLGNGAGGQQVLDNTELMEQMFAPAYAELTRAMGHKPADRKAWRTVLDPSRRLAELTNLLPMRRGKDFMAKPEWTSSTDASRKALLAIGDAVKQMNYELTRKRYEAAVESCNACHKQFDKEAPILKPYVPEYK